VRKNQQLAFTLVEVVIGAAIIAGSMIGIMGVFFRLSRVAEENIRLTKASYLLEEGMEAVRIMRDSSWANLASLTPGTDYYFSWTGLTWATSSTSVLVDGLYERKFNLAEVERGNGGEIVASGGTVDPATKLLTVEVAWSTRGATTTRSLAAYLTNLFE